MKKTRLIGFFCMVLTVAASAETVLFRTATNYTTTGESIEGTYDSPVITNVQEIAGLFITARTEDPQHRINADSGSLGINNTATNSDEAARFEEGEVLVLSFSKKVEISRMDFRYFDDLEVFFVDVDGGASYRIEWDALNNRSQDYIATNIVVEADTDIRLHVFGVEYYDEYFELQKFPAAIGLEGMDLTVLGGSGDLTLSLAVSNGTSYIAADFDGTAATNYVLQYCTNMVSNAWNNVSSFSADTNWVVAATNNAGFFRVITQ